jgi:hypothetical protein
VTSSFYAGPGRGILQINTWEELISAVQAGSLTETQWVECKKGVPATSPEANAELAKDLASLTVDGGVLVIGVKDKASSTEGVVGTDDDIEGLKDRITGIASGTRVMPPMQVIIGNPIPNPDKDNCYALLVSVPKSPSAPHMVAERYWGRSAVGKRPLSDVEVAALFTQRRLAIDTFEVDLRGISVHLDPIAAAERHLIHFSVLVRPEIPASGEFIGQIEAGSRLQNIIGEALRGVRYTPSYPSIIELTRRYAHPDGPAWEGTINPPADSESRYDVAFAEVQHMRLLVSADGAINVAAARGSTPLTGGHNTQIDLDFIVLTLYEVMSLAGALGQGAMSYPGMWRVGVHVNNMEGHLGYPPNRRGGEGQPLASAEYIRVASASTAELADRPVPIIDKILRGLARASGLRDDLAKYMDPETSPLP